MTRIRHFITAIALACGMTAQVQAQQAIPYKVSKAEMLPYQNPDLTPRQRAEDLCQRLTLEEKARIMMNGSGPVDRLHVPVYEWWSEGLHGVGRNGYSTVFPITMMMAATWNDALVQNVFDKVSDEMRVKNTEARHKGVIKRYQGTSVWTPNINIFRDPRWGRGQETYGEDPYLTERMGLAVVSGLQGTDLATGQLSGHKYYKLLACAKHFAVHSGPEWNRHSFDIQQLPERDLWETYLPAFKSLVQKGNVREVMCAYQRIDGDPCCGSNRYLQQILRDEWKFNGLVVSDCGAIGDFWIKGRHEVSDDAKAASAKAVISGTDVECGSNYKSLPEAVKAGQITEEQINTSVIRLLTARFEVGDFDADELVDWTSIPERCVASAEHKALALEAARQGVVLLQNRNGILPLQKSARIAVVGPNAADSLMLWGNYTGYATKTVSILDGIRALAGDVKYIEGCGYTRNEQMISRFGNMHTADGKPGMTASYWNNTELKGEPVATASYTAPLNLSNGGATVFAPGVNLENFSARYEGVYTADRTEKLLLTISADDRMRVIIAGDTIVDVWKSRERVQTANKEFKVEQGRDYPVVVEFMQGTAMAVLKFDIGVKAAMTPSDLVDKVMDRDVVVFVGGISPALEGEEMKVSDPGFKGGDRTTIELPQSQRDMVKALAAAGKRIVFVNCSGGAMALTPEAERCDGMLQAWYAGEQGGTAIAEVLFGDVNPSGKLPVTFYKDDSQLPDFLDYTMKGRTYRFFKGEPLWSFGHGLSYTSFEKSGVKVKKGKDRCTVTLNVSNTGKRDGDEVVQVYLNCPKDTDGPVKTLRAYQRVSLKAGETKRVEMTLSGDQLLWWDKETNSMQPLRAKDYNVTVK
ncbi:MAG: glycoside hydrolase family 3 C-terminal domain-containing protein [Prevotellaceae bacterium]|nr:glycoside hydrolase family 3 C-terminal domain-containing protein [Prevotellaceae bacterium]